MSYKSITISDSNVKFCALLFLTSSSGNAKISHIKNVRLLIDLIPQKYDEWHGMTPVKMTMYIEKITVLWGITLQL